MSKIKHEKTIDDFIAHFPVTITGRVLLKRKLRGILETELSLGNSLYDIDKGLIDEHIHELVHEKPWVTINKHV